MGVEQEARVFGDEASLNIQFKKGRRSAIYNSIIRLRDALSQHAFVAYTATPQANLLISGIDALSPDFGILVPPGEGYCGGSIFFGSDRDKYVRVVPLDEVDQDHWDGIPQGLRQAIATFLVGAAIRRLRGDGKQHSMLIHTSKLKSDHQRLQVAAGSLIGLSKEALSLPDSDPAAADVLKLARVAYDDLCITVMDPAPWNEVSEQLRREIWLVEVWMVNSLPIGKDPISTPFRLSNNIVIGGEMPCLGRV